MSFRKIWAQQQILKYLKIWIAASVQQHALNRKLNNNIGKTIDFRPRFSSSVALAERAAGVAGVSIPGEATPLCRSCLGLAEPRGLPPARRCCGAGRMASAAS